MGTHYWLFLGFLLPILHFGISRCFILIIYMVLFLFGILIYTVDFLKKYKMDHIRTRFIEGSLVCSSRCLHRLKPYYHSCNARPIKNDNIIKHDNTIIYDHTNNVISSKSNGGMQTIFSQDNDDEYYMAEDISKLNCSKSISGYPIIDDLLNQILDYIFRDYVDHWYYVISNNEAFTSNLKRCFRFALAKLCQQLKNVDMTSYMTKDLVEEFVNHLKIYKATVSREKRLRDRLSSSPEKSTFLEVPGLDGAECSSASTSPMRYSCSEPCFDKYSTTNTISVLSFNQGTQDKDNNSSNTTLTGVKRDTTPMSSGSSTSSPLEDDLLRGLEHGAEDLKLYFQVESEFENGTKNHDHICTDIEYQKSYLLVLAEILLYLIMPGEEYTRPVKTLLAEILVNVVLVPVIETFSDPDHINQMIIWLFVNYGVTSEQFLDVIRMSESLPELEAVKEIVIQEIGHERSKDSGGTDDSEIKQRLQSLTYLKRLIDSRCKRLSQGSPYEYQSKLKGLPKHQTEQLLNVKFEFILDHTLALDYFLNYLTSINCQNCMYFYLTIESFRSLAKQHISPDTINQLSHSNPSNQPINVKLVRNEAQKILDQYLSEKAPHFIRLNQAHVKVLRSKIKNEIPNPLWFDDLQFELLNMFLKNNGLFDNFKRSPLFVKMLAEMDLIPDARDSSETSSTHENDAVSSSYKAPSIILNESIEGKHKKMATMDSTYTKNQQNTFKTSTPRQASFSNGASKQYDLPHNLLRRALEIEYRLNAHVTHIVVSRESERTYAMYAITVTREPYHVSSSNEDSKSGAHKRDNLDSWCVYRRYSEFHDFHMNLRERYSDVAELKFPPKKPFGNMTKDFLEKRLKTLDSYLKALLAPEFLKTHKGLKDLMEQFLEPGSYEKWNGQIARTMDTFVNPLKSSVRFMGSMVKTVPENIADGVIKVSDTMIDGVGKLFSLTQNIPGFKMADTLAVESLTKASLADIEDVDNLAFKILILLMDEIFDLKTRNQWLRRRLMVIMRQVVQVAYGGIMNKKIIEQVDWLTLPEQVASFIKKFRDSFWPGGILASRTVPRSQSQKSRTKVLALVKIFAAIPDEIRTVVGSETTKEGVKMTFDMLQGKRYNKRYLYASQERFWPLLFPGPPGAKINSIITANFLSPTRWIPSPSSHRNLVVDFDFVENNKNDKTLLPQSVENYDTILKNSLSSLLNGENFIIPRVQSSCSPCGSVEEGHENDKTLLHSRLKKHDSISLNGERDITLVRNSIAKASNTTTNEGAATFKRHKRNNSTPLGKNVINYKQ